MIESQNNMKKKQIKSTDQSSEQAKNSPTKTLKKRLTYRDLSPKHWLFVQALFKHEFNQTEAYMSVYPDAERASATRLGSELAQNPLIKQAVEEKLEEIGIKDILTLERLLLTLNDMVTSDSIRNSDRNQSIMLLSKLLGYLNEEKIQVNVIGTDDLTEIRQRLSKKRSVNSISQEVIHNVQEPEKEPIKEIEAIDIKPIDSTDNNKNTDNINLT